MNVEENVLTEEEEADLKEIWSFESPSELKALLLKRLVILLLGFPVYNLLLKLCYSGHM